MRFHQGRASGPRYRREKLRRWADRLAALPTQHAFLYFNNDPEGAAIADARTMVELLAERSANVADADATAHRTPTVSPYRSV